MQFSKKILKVAITSAVSVAFCAISASALCNGTTNATALNFRAEPDGEVIGTIYQGEKFAIHENLNNWFKVTYRGATGYVSTEYAEWAPDGMADVGNGRINATNVNVRSEPNTDSKVLKKLTADDSVIVVGTSSGWYRIYLGNGEIGFVHSKYISFGTEVGQSVEDAINGSSSKGTSEVDKLLNYAAKFLGTPYVYGGSSPSGFDCSGFTSYVYRNALGISLPRTSRDQSTEFAKITSISALKPGDLVFFGSSTIGHVGIYVGDGEFIHSPHSGSSVQYDSLYGSYGNSFRWGGRVL